MPQPGFTSVSHSKFSGHGSVRVPACTGYVFDSADTMASIPQPYPAGAARWHVARRRVEREKGRSVTIATQLKAEERFFG